MRLSAFCLKPALPDAVFRRRLFRLTVCVIAVLSLPPSAGAASSAEELFQEARRLYNHGEAPRALEIYQTLSRSPDTEYPALLNQFFLLKSGGQYSQAIQLGERILQHYPDQAEVWRALGLVRYLNGEPEAALFALSQAAAAGIDDGWLWFWQGCCLNVLHDAVHAQTAFEQAVARDEQLYYAQLFLGSLLVDQGAYARAQTHLRRALELDPSVSEAYPLLGRVYFAQGNYTEALKIFQKIKVMDPTEASADQWVQKIYAAAGPDFVKALSGGKKERLQQSTVPAPTQVPQPGAPSVLIHLVDSEQFQFKCSADFEISGAAAGKYRGQAQQLYGIRPGAEGLELYRQHQLIQMMGEDIVIAAENDEPAAFLIFDVEIGKGQYWASRTDRRYRGQLRAVRKNRQMVQLLNRVNLEEYLYGVLPSEMPASWPAAALQAQAIAARSEAYAKIGRHRADGYDFCSTVHCQSYSGANAEQPASNAAVEATRGVIAVYNDRPIDALYSNNCGGHTQWNIFGDRHYVAYWPSKPDAGGPLDFSFPLSAWQREQWLRRTDIPVNCHNETLCRRSNFRWMRWYTQPQLTALVNKQQPVGTVREIQIAERMPSGHIDCVSVVGEKGTVTVRKELSIRQLFGNLRSSMFDVDVLHDRDGRPQAFIFYGGGWGHAVGMCQVGCATMAQNGSSAEDIITFYFSGAKIKKAY